MTVEMKDNCFYCDMVKCFKEIPMVNCFKKKQKEIMMNYMGKKILKDSRAGVYCSISMKYLGSASVTNTFKEKTGNQLWFMKKTEKML